MDTQEFQYLLAGYFRNLATWRRSRFQDDLRDDRNLRAADGLDQLAEFSTRLDESDARVLRLRSLIGSKGTLQPGQQFAYEAGRFHFYDVEIDCDAFLDFLVVNAEKDAGESGRFGGAQVPGDDPWGPGG